MADCMHPSLVAVSQKLLNEFLRSTFYKLSQNS